MEIEIASLIIPSFIGWLFLTFLGILLLANRFGAWIGFFTNFSAFSTMTGS